MKPAATRREAKDTLYEAFAEAARALSSGRRVELVDVLAQGERSVDELARELDQSVANTSHHLRALARAGFVTSRRAGNRIYYRLASNDVEELWRALRNVAARQVAGIDHLITAYLGQRDELEAITRDELHRRMQQGDVVVLDIRPEAEYEAGHIRGARSVPPKQLRRELEALPRDIEVVAYCRGAYCVYADDAIRALQDVGVTAQRLQDGFPEWRHAKLPVATGPQPDG